MIEFVKHLDGIGEDIQRLSGLIREAVRTEADPGVRQHLEGLNALMEHAFGKVRETLPPAEQELRKVAEDMSQATTRLQKDIETLEQRLHEAEQAAAAVVPPAAPAFDPRLGQQLRDELLKRFGPGRPGVAPADVGEVAEMVSHEFTRSPEEPRPPSGSKTLPPRPGPKQAPPKTDDEWSLDG